MRSASVLICRFAAAAQQPAAVVPGSACIPPMQLVDTLSLLRRRGPSLPLHSRWTPALPHPMGFGDIHGQQSQSCTVRSFSAHWKDCLLPFTCPSRGICEVFVMLWLSICLVSSRHLRAPMLERYWLAASCLASLPCAEGCCI